MTSILKLPRSVRKRLRKVVQKGRDIRHVRRAHAILLLSEGYSLSATARMLNAGRSAVQVWRRRFLELGEAGLVPSVLADRWKR
jgi:transposase